MLRKPNLNVITFALLAVVLAVYAGVGYGAPGGNGKGQGQASQPTTSSTTTTTTTTTTISTSTNGGGSTSGKGRGQGDPSCSANPNPAVVGQSFTLSAIGLPSTDMVWLIVSGPAGSSLTQVFVNPDGSWSGSEFASKAGTWTFEFSGPLSNNKYGTVAACSELVNSSGVQ